MSINVKKYTKDQMAKMVEDAAERQEAAEAEAAEHFKAGVMKSCAERSAR